MFQDMPKANVYGQREYIEEILWENPNPTSSFTTQTVTLSDSIDNYDSICFEYKYHSNSDLVSSYIVPTDVFKELIANDSNCLGLCAYYNAHNLFRFAFYQNDAYKITFGNCADWPGNASSLNDNYCIPLKVIGLKNPSEKIEIIAADPIIESFFWVNGCEIAKMAVSYDGTFVLGSLSDMTLTLLQDCTVVERWYNQPQTVTERTAGSTITMNEHNSGHMVMLYKEA